MAFTAALRSDLISVEAGATSPFTVEVSNKGSETERYELEIEGLDPEWTAVPVPVLDVHGFETISSKLFFKPPRSSESAAGNYPFVLRVRSLETGESRSLQGVLQIKPYHYLSMEVNPKKGRFSPTSKQNSFAVTIVNLGNIEHTIQLSGNDPEDACTYEFSEEQLALGPGQQREVEVLVTPSSKPLLSGSRLIGFSLTGRSLNTPQVVATAQAQLEQRPLLTPGTLAVVIILAALMSLWVLTLPKTPTARLRLDPRSPQVGQSVNIHWDAQNATGIEILANDEVISDSNDPSGDVTYQVKSAGVLTIVGIPRRDTKKGDPYTLRVPILTPEVVPLPVITMVEVNPKQVRLGQPFVLRYQFGESVVKATLSPTNQDLNLSMKQIEVTPLRAGKLDYEVVVENKEGKIARRAFSVEAIDTSDATILAFQTDTQNLPIGGGPIAVSWQVTNAERVELQVGGENQKMVLDPQGTTTVNISAKTMLKLIAYDQKGRSISRMITINVEPFPTQLPENTITPSKPPTTDPGKQDPPKGNGR
ncbi:MAG: hypothetical protein ACOYON_08305 [Fimbriimonas sp.]